MQNMRPGNAYIWISERGQVRPHHYTVPLSKEHQHIIDEFDPSQGANGPIIQVVSEAYWEAMRHHLEKKRAVQYN